MRARLIPLINRNYIPISSIYIYLCVCACVHVYMCNTLFVSRCHLVRHRIYRVSVPPRTKSFACSIIRFFCFFFVSFPLSVVISLLAINFVVSINAHTRGSLCSPRAQRRFTREAIHASMDKRDAIRQVRGAPVFVIPCKLNITWKEKERKKEWNKEKSISRDSAIN